MYDNQYSGICAKENLKTHVQSSLCVPKVGVRTAVSKNLMNCLQAGSENDLNIRCMDAFITALQIDEICNFPRNVKESESTSKRSVLRDKAEDHFETKNRLNSNRVHLDNVLRQRTFLHFENGQSLRPIAIS